MTYPLALPASLFLGATVNGRWQLGIGDPTPVGWFTTLSYAIAGLLCLFAALHTLRHPPCRIGRRAIFFWACCGLIMLFLAVNKQLDLQTFFTDVGRTWAKKSGWYDTRHVVQTWFIRGLAAAGLFGLLLVAWLIRGARPTYYLALIGLVFTGCFVVIRAASFHHVDALIGYEIAGIRMNWVFELGGILVVAASALAFREQPAHGDAAPEKEAASQPDDTVETPDEEPTPDQPAPQDGHPMRGSTDPTASPEKRDIDPTQPRPGKDSDNHDATRQDKPPEENEEHVDDDSSEEDDDDDDDNGDLPDIIILDP